VETLQQPTSFSSFSSIASDHFIFQLCVRCVFSIGSCTYPCARLQRQAGTLLLVGEEPDKLKLSTRNRSKTTASAMAGCAK
jgi:hypothetical protein